jgi:hypothetical protein
MILADFLGVDIAPGVGAALITVAAGALLALLRAAVRVASDAQDRRRRLYSKAYKDAMAWREMVYRVRRRTGGEETDRALIERFHKLQERIDYYEGWTASESRWMGRSYCRLVNAIKEKCAGPLRDAWTEGERRPPADGSRGEDVHPNLTKEREVFLKDVRNHLSLWLFPKLFVVWRNFSETSKQEENPDGAA